MIRNILMSGILGGAVMFAATLACRILLPGTGAPLLQPMPGQVQIHAALKERITQPGTYVCPYLPPEERRAFFPNYLNEPVFAITYRGHTHATVPGFASVGMLSFLLAPMAASWLLSQASARVLASYWRRYAYIAALGVFIILDADLMRNLTDDLSFKAVVGIALVDLITWTLVGLVLAWSVRPRRT